MGIMRWAFYEKLKETYPSVEMTFGYITKNTRIRHNLPKTHYIDARCISSHPDAEPLGHFFFQKKVRCHNRQIHKANFSKGSVRKRNQSEHETRGFRLFDKVEYNGKEYFIFGRRKSGYFDIRDLQKSKASNGSISFRKLKLVERAKYYLTERRMQREEEGSYVYS